MWPIDDQVEFCLFLCNIWLWRSQTENNRSWQKLHDILLVKRVCVKWKNSWEPLNLYQSNCAAASKQALLIYDSSGLVLRQWIAALSWLVFIKRLHSLITHHMRGRLVGCTDRVTLGLLCVCMCVCLCVAAIHIWRAPQNMVHSTGNQTKKVLYKICWRKQKSGTRGNIFSCAPRVCVWVPAIPFWKVFVDFQSFCRGEFE